MISFLRSFVEFVRGSATRTKKAHSRRRVNHHSALRVESLEPRRLLSVSQILFDAEAAQITISGTSGSDQVTVSYLAPDLINVKVKSGDVSQNVQFPVSSVVAVSFTGEDGNDTFLNTTDVRSIVFGGAGDDVLTGGSGDDELNGGDGIDRLSGQDGDDMLRGNTGNDLLYGNGGIDNLKGDEDHDQLFGGEGNDFLTGAEGNDSLWGASGDDHLLGGDGDDILVGQEGNDYLNAGLGNDLLIGGMGADNLDGMAGNDLLIGGTTVYDGAPNELHKLLQQWTADASYSERIATLENENNSVRLDAEETVLDDLVADMIVGGDDFDWFFLTGSMPYYSPVMKDPSHEHEDTGSHHHDHTVIHTLPPLEGFNLIDSLDNLQDVQSAEAIHSKVPHVSDLRLQREHLSLFELVRYDEVTHFAIADGNWSNPSTWLNGVVPTDGARVLISHGVHVNVDRVIAARLKTVRVDGTLSFATQSRSELRVDTLVVSSAGAFEMGTALTPIAPHVTARLLITNTGSIDRAWDPYGVSRGLISHGRTTINGTPVLEQSTLQGTLVAGTTQITLADVPQGWKVGDDIVIAGTVAGAQQDEVRKVLGIAERIVTIAPLAYDHLTPSTTMPVYVAHLTRNAVVESESTAIARRGHVMLMHSRDVDIQNAGFYRLGRTDKLQAINDAVVDSNWRLQAGTGTNVRGRYAVHFHRNGLVNDGNPAVIHGSVVIDSPGWGFVNHSSYVDMTNNVAFDVRGAAFATEVGDEIGSFRNNIAIRMTGSGEHINARIDVQDFGHQGDGFWFQGGGVSVIDNVAAGSAGNAFIFYTRGLVEGGVLQEFHSINLVDSSISGGAPTIKVDFIPVREFARNVGFASSTGLAVRYNLRNAPHQQRSVFQDSVFWNNTTGVDLTYSHQSVLRDLTVVNAHGEWPQTAIASNSETHSIVYENLVVAGYRWGIEMAQGGSSVVVGGIFSNKRDIVIQPASYDNRSVLITGPIQFVDSPERVLDVYMRPIPMSLQTSIMVPFYNDSVTLNYGPFESRRVYSDLQHPLAIPFPVPQDNVPLAFIGLTSQQLRDIHGLTIGGELAPLSAVAVPRIGGLVAP